MKHYIWVLIALLPGLTAYSPAHAQSKAQTLQQMQVDVVYLSSDLLAGRETGTEGEAMAAQYIASRFEALGLSPKGTDGWYQAFDFTFSTNPHAKPEDGEDRTGKNVLGFIDHGAEHTIVIGGHYDHLGMGHFGSREVHTRAIHNGADDNASGIAVMLDLAARLSGPEYTHNNYLFIAFSGEELGLYGSKYFVSHPTVELAKINYMLNFDMVGRLNDAKALAVNAAGTSPIWKKTFEKIETEIEINTHDSGIGPSDHTSFYLKDLPVLHFFSGQHDDYHKPADDSELVNYEGMYEISDLVQQLIALLDNQGKVAFSKTKDQTQTRTSFKVTLGIMPDYVSTGEGMRIDAVLDERPAAKAGLEDGDIVIKMGDLPIGGMEDYMKALGAFEKGQTITVVVKRGKKKISKKVTF
ncbi:MAG: DUF4910 domain-containing protein [Bacteroidota bacterium]